MVHSQDFYQLYQTTFEKYTDLYGEHVCVFLLKGSFYELYGIYDPETDKYENTVKEVADLLDLQLKVYPKDVCPMDRSHGSRSKKTGLFGGVPEHTIHKWAGKLCQQGWTCILIDQVKDLAGNVKKREVARVLSPGTHIEQAVSDESMYVISLWLAQEDQSLSYGIAATECSTGEVVHFEGKANGTLNSWHADSAAQFISTFQPKEVIIHWTGSALFCPEENNLRIIFEIAQHIPIYLRIIDTDPFDNETIRLEYMSKCLPSYCMLPFRTWAYLTNKILSERALCSLFQYLEQHDHGLIDRLQAPEPWNPENTMMVLNHAMEQLNIKSANPNNNFTIEKLFNKCATAIGKRHFKKILQTPSSDSKYIQSKLDNIEWTIRQDKDTRRNLETCLRSMSDISRLHRSISRGQVTHVSAQQIVQTFEALKLLNMQLVSSPLFNTQVADAITLCYETLKKLLNWSTVLEYTSESDEYINWLHSSISPLSEEAYKNLSSIREEADKWLREFEIAAKITPNTLTFKNGESSRYQVTITKTQQKQIPSTQTKYIFKTMSSNVKVENAALDKLHDKTLAAESKFKLVAAKEIANFCIEYCKTTRTQWKVIDEWIAQTDISITHATIAEKYGLKKPTIIENSTFSEVNAENLRHPLIEAQKTRVKYTTHNISLDDQASGMLLYGINASGKSSLMKAIGIAVVLAQSGLYVPATSFTLSPFKTIATRILNHDNIAQGMSSFTVEMSELREILRVADSKTLILGDEVCAGTESISGTAIVAASIEYLLKKGSRFVFATHLHDLQKCEIVKNPLLKIFHLRVEYDSATDTLIYHRTLTPGSGTTYYGLEVAKALHIPFEVLDAATKIRSSLLSTDSGTKSHWNKNHLVRSCEECGSNINNDLEVHHIQPRADAEQKRNSDGTALNGLRNLMTVCKVCHDKHHAEEIELKQVLITSKGEKRITAVSKKIVIKKKYTQEQETLIHKCIFENSGLQPELIKVILSNQDIQVSVADIKRFISHPCG